MKRFVLSLCVVAAFAAGADTAADAVMLRKKGNSLPVSGGGERPTRSFLEDVAPVKEAGPEAREMPPPEVVQPPAAPAAAPKPVAEAANVPPAEAPKPAPKTEKAAEKRPSAETPKPAPSPAPAVEKKATAGKDAAGEKKPKAEKKPPRDAIITSDRTDYDRKEGVVLFDRNVHVDDEQYQMHADRLFLFLDGTNDLKRLVAIGHVAITNEDKRAYCARATFNKKLGRIVMYSSDEITAQLHEEGKKGSDVKGEKIIFWLNSEQVEVENPVITMPGGIGGQDSMKKLIGK